MCTHLCTLVHAHLVPFLCYPKCALTCAHVYRHIRTYTQHICTYANYTIPTYACTHETTCNVMHSSAHTDKLIRIHPQTRTHTIHTTNTTYTTHTPHTSHTSHTHTHTHTTPAHVRTLTNACARMHTQTITYSQRHTHTHSQTHTYTHTHERARTHTHTHADTHRHTHIRFYIV